MFLLTYLLLRLLLQLLLSADCAVKKMLTHYYYYIYDCYHDHVQNHYYNHYQNHHHCDFFRRLLHVSLGRRRFSPKKLWLLLMHECFEAWKCCFCTYIDTHLQCVLLDVVRTWRSARPSIIRSQFDMRCRKRALVISRVLTGMTGDQWSRMMADNGWNEVELRDSRYNQVVHMVSIADASTGRRRHFSSHEGMDIATARQLDLSISQVHADCGIRTAPTMIAFRIGV